MASASGLRAFARISETAPKPDRPDSGNQPSTIVVHSRKGREIVLEHAGRGGKPGLWGSVSALGADGEVEIPMTIGEAVRQGLVKKESLAVDPKAHVLLIPVPGGGKRIPFVLDAAETSKVMAHLAAHPASRKLPVEGTSGLHAARQELESGVSQAKAKAQADRRSRQDSEWAKTQPRRSGESDIRAAQARLTEFDTRHPEIRAEAETRKISATRTAMAQDDERLSHRGAAIAAFRGAIHIRPTADVARAAVERGARGGIFQRLRGGGRRYIKQ